MRHPSTDAHRFTTIGTRVYVRGHCPRCKHATSDAGPPGWQPARVIEYIERNADGETIAWVNELQPCPWTLCPRRRPPDRPPAASCRRRAVDDDATCKP